MPSPSSSSSSSTSNSRLSSDHDVIIDQTASCSNSNSSSSNSSSNQPSLVASSHATNETNDNSICRNSQHSYSHSGNTSNNDVSSVKESSNDNISLQATASLHNQVVVFVPEFPLPILAAIMFFSILGTAARIGLIAMHTYTNPPVLPGVYVQGVGCLLMGAFIQWKMRILYRSSALYVGLSVGLCGSITTFSSMLLWIYQMFYNWPTRNRSPFDDVLSGIGALCICLLASSGSFAIGQTWARMLTISRWPEPMDEEGRVVILKTQRLSYFHFTQYTWIDIILVVLGPSLLVAMILSAIFFPNSRTYTIACAFGPLGAILRYYLSWFNYYSIRFPFGTFVANMLGTLILAVLFSVSHVSLALSSMSCLFINALSDGFCGCLTTVSTFIVELHSLPNIDAHRYATISIVLGLLMMIIGPGTLYWTHGPLTAQCGMPTA